MNAFQGHFLVAAPHQLDPNFAGMVILVVEHTEEGAFGVIVNCLKRPHDRLPQQRGTRRFSTGARLYCGGPVTGPLMAVHTNAALGEWQLLPGVFFSGREKHVLALMRQAAQPLKIFAGYAGWGAGELDFEVEQGIWRVAPATAEQVFSDDDDLWEPVKELAAALQFKFVAEA